MKYVYILQSLAETERHYTCVTADVASRLEMHNAGKVPHTSKYKPWRLETYVAFTDAAKAHAFEAYLKSGSGRAFARKRF